MNNEELKEFCLNLVKAESASQVNKILKIHELINDNSAWRDFGDRENNFSTAGNQQNRPEVALVEKIINSIDSTLTKECISKGIDPESSEAPQSIDNAIESFYNVKNGKLTELTANERTKLAEKSVGIVASGFSAKKGYGSYSIFDFGEGQKPRDIPNTFMSIGKSNKIKIPFVQGKFNMGGTGVFRFAPSEACQLLVTKRNPNLNENLGEDDDSNWSFTIVKRIHQDNFKSSKFVYLVNPQNNDPSLNNVFSFRADSLDILPGKYPDPYGTSMMYGSYIKLYEYKMDGLKSNITLDLYNRLSLLIPNIPLPIRLYERREGYKANSSETTLNGISVRLEEDKTNNLESEDWPITIPLSVEGITITIKVFAFKESENSKRPTAKYTKEEGVIFVINGQTHGHFPRSFFKRKRVGLSLLSDCLIAIVDCSNLSQTMKEDLFMNSRDRLVETGDLKSKIESQIEKLLKEHPGLVALKQARHQKLIQDKIGDSKPLEDIINGIMKSSPSLSSLFIKGTRIKNPFDLRPGNKEEEFIGEEFPTTFTLVKKYPESNPRNFPNNNDSLRIQFKTDVRNDYFDREKDPGEHILLLNGERFRGGYFMNLWNGIATLNIDLNQKYYIGDVLNFTSIIKDISHLNEPFESDFFVEITKPQDKSKSKSKGDRKKHTKPGDGNSKENNALALPNLVEVEKNDENWKKFKFSDETALSYVNMGEDSTPTFFINMHNIYFLNEKKLNRTINIEIIDEQYKTSNVLIGMSLLKSEKDGELKLKEDYGIEELIKDVTKSTSMVLLPMIVQLGELKLD